MGSIKGRGNRIKGKLSDRAGAASVEEGRLHRKSLPQPSAPRMSLPGRRHPYSTTGALEEPCNRRKRFCSHPPHLAHSPAASCLAGADPEGSATEPSTGCSRHSRFSLTRRREQLPLPLPHWLEEPILAPPRSTMCILGATPLLVS